jgi:hypothetical protein
MYAVILTRSGETVGSFNAETIEEAHYDAKAAIRRGAADAYRIL